MTELPPCRLIVDTPNDGAWNMAVDQVLLESVAAGGLPTLRFYQWREPTLSLGYFQKYDERHRHATSVPLPVVRRATGGGALVHDHELTYSLVLPVTHAMAKDSVGLTCIAHQTLRAALVELGAEADRLTLCSPAGPEGPPASPPAGALSGREARGSFLCFERRAAGDLVWITEGGATHKLCGSAQRKRRAAVVQHGGFLLRKSSASPELPGLEDLAGAPFAIDRVQAAWCHKLLEGIKLTPSLDELTESQKQSAAELADKQFTSRQWAERR